jgi:hypothetical protein
LVDHLSQLLFEILHFIRKGKLRISGSERGDRGVRITPTNVHTKIAVRGDDYREEESINTSNSKVQYQGLQYLLQGEQLKKSSAFAF